MSHLISQSTRAKVIFRDENKCQYCGQLVDTQCSRYDPLFACCNLFIPVKYGGRPRAENLITSCRQCSNIKNDLDTRAMTIDDVRRYVNQYRAEHPGKFRFHNAAYVDKPASRSEVITFTPAMVAAHEAAMIKMDKEIAKSRRD